MGKILWMVHNLYQQEAQFALAAAQEGALLARQIRRDYGKHFIYTLFAWMMIAMAACSSTRPVPPSPQGVEQSPGPPPGDSGGTLPEVNPLQLGGAIVVAGSSTVFPLTERMAERFIDEGYAGQLTIDSIGSGAGFERLCVAGEIDISNASRPIKESEVESCREIGRDPIAFRVGTDALAVAVSQENDFVDGLTLEQLALVFSTAETWSEVDPSWPDELILRFSPGTDSGTFDYFVEQVFEGDKEPILTSNKLQLSEDDNVLIQGILGSPYAIGYFGYAYYDENADTLKVVAIEGVEPTGASVEDKSYPLARPLFIYSDAGVLQAKPQVADFINFYLTYANEEVLDVGYFPVRAGALDEARRYWLDAMGMSR
jgi:phosphate transport system substrate-binding protein